MKEPAISVVPANEASWEDLQTVFGTRGMAVTCQCQRYKLRPRESFASFPVEERAFRLRRQTDCGHPGSDTTSGLVAYPWEGRAEDRTDDGVWAVTCLFTRALEGYPIVTKDVILEELHVGTEAVFADAGFTEVSRPTLRRTAMRIDF